MSIDLVPLFQAIRVGCSAKSWSRGIELVRGDNVVGIEDDEQSVTLRVKTPGVTVAPIVILYPEDEEWECDCASTADACEHVAAAMIALRQARKEGARLPASQKVGGTLGYRLSIDGDRLVVKRVVVTSDGVETLLVGTVASQLIAKSEGPALEASKLDLTIDRLLEMRRQRSLAFDAVKPLLPLLAQLEDVQLDGQRVAVGAEPMPPKVTVRDAKKGFSLCYEKHPSVERVLMSGLALSSDSPPVLRALGFTEVTGMKLELLPRTTHYAPSRVGELVSEVLPQLRKRLAVEVLSRRLPSKREKLPPRVVIEVSQRHLNLSVLPVIVYGEPACARIDGSELVHLGGAIPERDQRAEERLVQRLRETLDLVPGRRVDVVGQDAAEMATRLRNYSGKVQGDAHVALYPEAPLEAQLTISGDRFEASFVSGELQADAGAVLEAWQAGHAVVPLLDGGWAQLPAEWLQQHGHRVAELLAGRDDDGALRPHAKLSLGVLCDELEHPRPAELAGLAPLLDGFERLPEVDLEGVVDAELRPYQQRGVEWLSFLRDAGLGAVLADDMGLGKTLQAMSVFTGRTLVVCPRSVVHNWADELERFRPALSRHVYHGPGRKLDPEADVTLTTYALVRNDIEELSKVHWNVLVLDESQAIKNPDSQVARAAFQLDAAFRLTLSGTPVENRLEELWSQLHFANPGLLGGRGDFRRRYGQPIAAGEPGAAKRLRDRIRPFVLRRLKSEVLKELPPRTDLPLYCVLEKSERELYETVLAAARADVVKQLEGGGSVMGALEALLRLRQAACDTGLLPGQAKQPGPSSKVRRLLEALQQVAEDGHKALVFSQWTGFLNRVEPHLEAAGIAYLRLDGSTRDRAGVVAQFQDPAGPPVLLISLKAGGTGLNLTAADHVFLLDPWWNPAVEDQAADRAHRMGQERPVMVYRLVAEDTVEERIVALQEHKRSLADAALGEADQALSLTRDDLLALLN